MNIRQAIKALAERGYSERKIARELGRHRKTVAKYLRAGPSITRQGDDDVPNSGAAEQRQEDSKCTISTPGSEPDPEVTVEPGPGSQPAETDGQNDSKCTIPTPGPEIEASPLLQPGRASHCEPYRALIESKLEDQLHAKRIWQDLVDDYGFEHSYQSVKRFVARLKQSEPERIWRMECEPGEEVQVDYGTMRVEIAGRKKKIHLLRLTLSHSRKGYTEAMPRQDAESFIRGIENAFRHFEGVPRLLVLDNLKAGVLKADHYDPELNPKFATFCQHYGIVAMPTLPRTPQHKGKVERGVDYVQESAVRRKRFDSLHELNSHLRRWEKTIADKRIHGTTRKQVTAHFLQSEKSALQPLPDDLFPSFVEAKRKVHRDSYIEFKKSYYEVPPEYISRELWVRSDGRLVHLFNLRMEQVAVHSQLEPGLFTKALGCGGTHKSVCDSLHYWENRASQIGDDVGLWAKGLVLRRKEASLRPLMGLVNQLFARHGSAALNRACGQARLHGQYRLKELNHWLEEPAEQQAFSFLSDHQLIRGMDAYGDLVGFEENN